MDKLKDNREIRENTCKQFDLHRVNIQNTTVSYNLHIKKITQSKMGRRCGIDIFPKEDIECGQAHGKNAQHHWPVSSKSKLQ